MNEEGKKFFIDTNILMYAAGRNHKYKKPCTKVLYYINNIDYSFYINTETIQEILYRYTKINLKSFGIKLATNVLNLFDSILLLTVEDIYQSINLLEKYNFLISRDALIIANMVNHDIENIISADKVFDKVDEVLRIDPIDFI
jgi:predicted nucleic acid-binding protein